MLLQLKNNVNVLTFGWANTYITDTDVSNEYTSLVLHIHYVLLLLSLSSSFNILVNVHLTPCPKKYLRNKTSLENEQNIILKSK